MSFVKNFLKEMEMEAQTTRKILQLVPDDKLDWQPHPKSMVMKKLASHVAEIPTWLPMVLNTSELDFANMDYKPVEVGSNKELMDYFEKSLAEGLASLTEDQDAHMAEIWTMREGDTIYDASPKSEVIRMTINHLVHHRAQLGVYLRLLDIPIPGSYGPSADAQM